MVDFGCVFGKLVSGVDSVGCVFACSVCSRMLIGSSRLLPFMQERSIRPFGESSNFK